MNQLLTQVMMAVHKHQTIVAGKSSSPRSKFVEFELKSTVIQE